MNKALILIALLMVASLAFAHPAGKVTASLNQETSVLTVNFEHKVSNNADHFINAVIIQINGKDSIRHTLTLQESKDGGNLLYRLPSLKKGDKITVTTDCNKGGKKTANVTVK